MKYSIVETLMNGSNLTVVILIFGLSLEKNMIQGRLNYQLYLRMCQV